MFKREGARYSEDIVHEKVLLPEGAKVGQIKTGLMHHSFLDVSHALFKINKYSSYSAKIRIQNKKAPGLAKILGGTFWMFFRTYFLQKGFLDGKAGFLFAVFGAQGTFFRGIKQIYKDSDLEELPEVVES